MINKNRITFVPFLTCLIANILFTDLGSVPLPVEIRMA